MQITDTILMVRPASFAYNEQTAVNNFFQSRIDLAAETIQQKAVHQFDVMVKTLKDKGIHVIVAEDTKEPSKPDAVFPNNWISTNSNGVIYVFPMFAKNRRLEKRDDILKLLQDSFLVNDFQDWTEFEAGATYLEGTAVWYWIMKIKLFMPVFPKERTSLCWANLQQRMDTGPWRLLQKMKMANLFIIPM
jgi:hypothetical protein